jgi:peptidoglycan hydrolase CwlO-like protein
MILTNKINNGRYNMKKWLFSNNGTITDPFTFTEAQKYISANPNEDLYVWHPSFTYWMPLYEVYDFDVEISIPAPPARLSNELLNEYKNQEEKLFKTISRIDNTLGNTRAALSELNNDIDTYQSFTEKLNTEVEVTLENVNLQYKALQKSINDFKKEELVF